MPSPDRKRVFDEFHRRVGLKTFAPEFVNSLTAVMRDPEACLSERVFAWARWRAWGNSSEHAVSDWDPGVARFLDQRDCAVDLAWLEEGKPIEWLEGAPEDFRNRARGGAETPSLIKDKSKISRAFSKNERRGTIQFDGHKVIPVVTQPLAPQKKLTVLTSIDGNLAFSQWWKEDDPDNFLAFEVARNAYYAARRVARRAYRRYKDQATSDSDILINVKTLANKRNPPTNELFASGTVDNTHEPVRQEGRSFDPSLTSDSSLISKVRKWLVTSFKLPTAPDDEILAAITRYCGDEEGLRQLKAACADLRPRKWIVFLKIAKGCADHRKDYDAANTTPPGSTGEKSRPRWAEGL